MQTPESSRSLNPIDWLALIDNRRIHFTVTKDNNNRITSTPFWSMYVALSKASNDLDLFIYTLFGPFFGNSMVGIYFSDSSVVLQWNIRLEVPRAEVCPRNPDFHSI